MWSAVELILGFIALKEGYIRVVQGNPYAASWHESEADLSI
jgi:hypothetical protein